MKTSAVTLFAVGLILEILAFVVDKAEHIPFVYDIVASEYVAAQAGLEILEQKMILRPEDTGFDVLAELCITDLLARNSYKPQTTLAVISRTKVREIRRRKAYLHLDGSRRTARVPIDFALPDKMKAERELEEVEEWVRQLKSGPLFRSAFAVFALGILLLMSSFALQARTGKAKS